MILTLSKKNQNSLGNEEYKLASHNNVLDRYPIL